MRKVLKYLLVLLTSVAIGYLLLVASYLLPTDVITNNVYIDSKLYMKEGEFPNVILENEATKVGNHTDELMLLEAIYDGDESAFEKAITVSRKEIPHNDYKYTLYKLDHILDGTEFTETTTYTRYWHGYLIVLKPLLMLFSHNQIKYINIVVQTLLFVYVLHLMLQRNLKKYIIPFVISNLMIYPFVIAITMQFSIVYYILLISLVILLKWWDSIKNRLPTYFFIIGIATCYFDYFTWPLVTVGIPLLFVCLLKENKGFAIVKDISMLSITWILGYSLMWIGKLGLGSLILGENIFTDALDQATYRSSLFTSDFAYMMDSINYNFSNMLLNRPNVFILICMIVIFVTYMCKTKKKINLRNLINNLPLLLVCLYPIIWFVVVANHSYVHYWMAYRILIITIFGVQSYIVSVID